jgi:hypothetical protein
VIRKSLLEADGLVKRYCVYTEILLGASLLAAGFHRHTGAWRKRQKRKFVAALDAPLASDLPGLFAQAQAGDARAVVHDA